MKRIKKFFIFLFAIILICIIVNMSASAKNITYKNENNDSELACNDWINEKGGYEFPVNQFDDMWYEFESVNEMRDITQLPEELINNISTEELIQLILQYPLLCDLNAFSTVQEGYNHLKAQFNGIEELLERPDAFEQLISAYKNYSIPLNKKIDYNYIDNEVTDNFSTMCNNKEMRIKIYDDANINDSINILEYMLLDVIKSNSMDTQEFIEVYMSKAEQKEKSEYYKNKNSYDLLFCDVNNDVSLFSEYITTYGSNETLVISTPSGDRVTVDYYSTLVMCNSSEYANLIATYNATHISTASTTFNCHSYAWLKDWRTDYQHIWLSNPLKFTLDPYYKVSSIAKVGDIAYYNSGAHSAIVTRINVIAPNDTTGNVQSYCISKWGAGPMVGHYLKRCPYYTNESSIKYYRPAQ